MAEIEAYYQTSGNLSCPLVTIHNTKDPLVQYCQMPLYSTKTSVHGASKNHFNIPIFRYGHCSFERSELEDAFNLLVFKVAGKKYPSLYAKSSWPSIHRDSRNSDYLPFITTHQLEKKWHALEGEYSSVLTSVVTGPEGNIYFTTGKDEAYGNLHAFDKSGNELWRSNCLDNGAFGSSPLIGKGGDLYIGDTKKFYSFHSDGALKWESPTIADGGLGIDPTQLIGPFASSAFLPNGLIVAINASGMVYVFDPQDGHLAAVPLMLPGVPPPSLILTPAGLWKCPDCDELNSTINMVYDGSNLTIEDIFNGLLGYKLKIVNTADSSSGYRTNLCRRDDKIHYISLFSREILRDRLYCRQW